MKVTGYKLKEEIKKTNLTISMLENEFKNSKKKFEGEDKRSLDDITIDLFKAEEKVCKLQEATHRYNLKVADEVKPFGKVTLSFIIKIVGPISRIEKRWRQLAAPKRDRHRIYDDEYSVKDKDKEYAEKTYTQEQAGKQAHEWASRLAGVRSALALMNAQEIELDIPESLFE